MPSTSELPHYVCRYLIVAILVGCGHDFTAETAHAQLGNPLGGGGSFGGGPGRQAPPPPAERPMRRIPRYGPKEKTPILEVTIKGLKAVPESRVQGLLQTRPGRSYDPELVQADVRELIATGLFRDVRTFKRREPAGIRVTFELFERPVMQHVRVVGNEKVKDKKLLQELNMRAGDPLNRFAVEEGKRRIEQLYEERGFSDSHVTILEGVNPHDAGVVYQIHEGRIVRIAKTKFVGHTFVTAGVLRTKVESKPGILWLIGGKANLDQVDQDKDRLTAYYRSFGFFRARVGRKLEYNADKSWATITFVIDEGPRYDIRSVRFEGNKAFPTEHLAAKLQVKAKEPYNLGHLQRDLQNLRDEYGSQGYIFADINTELKFHEQPGILDVVYKVDEGQQYRVGEIHVNIDGSYAHTRRNVVLNRLSIRPGDVVDIRELRASERRLQASQLFLHDPSRGVTPKIVVKPPKQDDAQLAEEPDLRRGTIRGQNASSQRVSYRPTVDLQVNTRFKHWRDRAAQGAQP